MGIAPPFGLRIALASDGAARIGAMTHDIALRSQAKVFGVHAGGAVAGMKNAPGRKFFGRIGQSVKQREYPVRLLQLVRRGDPKSYAIAHIVQGVLPQPARVQELVWLVGHSKRRHLRRRFPSAERHGLAAAFFQAIHHRVKFGSVRQVHSGLHRKTAPRRARFR